MKELENLINQFNSDNLNSLMRAKTRTFRRIDESLSHLNDEQFNDCTLFGEFKLNNDDLMVVITSKVKKPLSERSGKKAQYTLGKKFLKDSQRYVGGFFIFYDDKGDFRFSLIYDIPLPTGKRDYNNFRRYTYFVSKDQTNKTFIRQIEEADFSSLEKIIEAFSVEKVTKQFYQEIANWYFWALKNVKFPDDAEAEMNGREISVIRLITRLIFIWFMKVRKLVPEELFDEERVKQLLVDLKPKNNNFYKAILQNLFFATLNTKPEERRFTSKKKGYKGFSQDFGNHNVYRYEEEFKDSEEVIEKYFMPIPFLNGGLFECLDYKSKIKDERKYIDGFTSTKSQQPNVPNELFFAEEKKVDLNKDYGTTNKNYNVRGLLKTLSQYNFTIDESDPNDADVALDPELLGKVFENLLASYNPETAKTARKSTGSYYTPRPIVDYMVDESLKQYFKTHLQTDDIDNKLKKLFSDEEQANPFNSDETKKLVDLIDSLRVVDPAVGSGAFPMRILNRLVFLLHKLDPDNSLWKQSQIEGIKKSVKDVTLQRKFIEETERKFKEKNPDYGRKLYLIEKCIYGVDIQQIAVEIAKLRFFISLLVDEKIENGEIEPLPNLDFKLMQGNSLISSFAGIDFSKKPENDDNLFDFDDKYRKLIDEFEELKSQYQNEPDVHKKRNLRDEIDAKLLEIFEEKLNQHYPQLKELESKYGGRKEIIEAEKKNLFKRIGIDLDQAEKDLIAYTEGRKPKDFFLWDVYFAEVFAERGGFDIVIGNPPYDVYQGYRRGEIEEIKKYKIYNKAACGKLNAYKLFLAKSIELQKPLGLLCEIFQNSFLGDNSAKLIRKYFLQEQRIHILDSFPERDDIHLRIFESVKMSICILLSQNIQLNNYEFILRIWSNRHMTYGTFTTLSNLDILNLDKEYATIPLVNQDEFRLLKKISKVERLINFAKCYEGEINLTFHKNYLRKEKNSFAPMIKGAAVQKWFIKEKMSQGEIEYLDKSKFLIDNKGKKVQHHKLKRIVMQGITGVDEKNRLKMTIINPGIFCGNSVNYILLNNNQIYDNYLLAVLNSKLLNWYFKIFSTNSNVNGYEVDNLPIPVISKKRQKFFIEIVKKLLVLKKQNPQADTKELEDQIDIMVYKLYELKYDEVKIIDPAFALTEKEYENYKIE